MIRITRLFAGAALAHAAAALVLASGTASWEMNSYSDFIRGRFSGVSLSRDGRLSLAPRVDPVFSTDQPVIWSVARGADGTLYAATGHRGRVYRIDGRGNASLLWTADQPEVFAIAADRSGAVYAATSPDGAVYRIENGKAAEYFNPKARYIWSLALGSDGALYVGTGEEGKVFRVSGPGRGELYYETGQSHVTGLAVDPQGRLLAGTEPNGILYRISAKDKAFVLYDANLPEIRAIVPLTDGTVYASAMGGSVAKRAQAASQATQTTTSPGAIPVVTTSITVEAQAGDFKPPETQKPQQSATVAAQPVTTTTYTPTAIDLSGVEKSAVYRINPDNTVETLWTSKEENVYDLLALEKQLLFSTDVDGRIYGLTPDRRVTLVAETGEGETTRLLPSERSVLAATSNMGRIFRLGDTPGSSGWFEAPVHDAGNASRWGSVSWRADAPAGTSVAFRTRSGNSARPDRTWSDWSDLMKEPAGSRITSPNARYIQWRAELTGSGAATPVLDTVTLAYLPQNSPPVVRSISVTTQAAPSQTTRPVSTQTASAYSITVTDTGDPAPSTSTGTPTQTLARAAGQQIIVTWQADDPDNDRLVYHSYFRGEGENEWKLIKSAEHDASVIFDSDIFADGKYYFRVVASDREANPPSSAREGELMSAPVMIDNTPPSVAITAARRTGAAAHIEVEAFDAASPLRRSEYSLDAKGWAPVEASDGVVDSLKESFTVDLSGLAAGERLLVFRVLDSAGNTGTAKVVLK